jgi:hypothetical protein
MARGKSNKLAPFQKLMLVMQSGNQVTIDEIDATLGKEIHMYRLSTYIWLMKTNANAVVKAIKTGRKITAYQIMNVDEVKEYLKRTGVSAAGFTPGQSTKIVKAKKTATVAPVQKLEDLKAEPVAEVVEDTADEFEVTEITDKEEA